MMKPEGGALSGSIPPENLQAGLDEQQRKSARLLCDFAFALHAGPVLRPAAVGRAAGTQHLRQPGPERAVGTGQLEGRFRHAQVTIAEGKPVHFRAEAYNLFNHPNIYNPNGNMNKSGNRTMQMALRFVF
ncbi:MAG: hypothetical protein ACE15B_11075 [Bryobacteraceae bacterium]